jgi:hypothetical protein
MATADITILALHEPEANDAARKVPLANNSRAIATGVAESIAVPTTDPTAANFVRIAVTEDTYVNFAGAAAIPTDLDDGTASELLPAKSWHWFYIRGVTAISVITNAATGIVTASFYR